MKKIAITLVLIIFIIAPAFAEDGQDKLLKGVDYYKNENYLGTIQVMQEAIKNNPGSLLAHYYLAISYAQIGNLNKAEEAYDKVIFLDPNSQLAALAELGKERLHPELSKEKEGPDQEIMKKFEDDLYSENVEESIKKRRLEYIIDKVNKNKEIDPDDLRKFEDFTPDKTSKPTQEEIAQAYQTLARAGLSPNSNYGFNPELMRMNMMTAQMGGGMGAQGGFNPANMLPFLMMMQNQQGQNNVSPDFMQSMLSNMMMPGMSGLYGDNNNY